MCGRFAIATPRFHRIEQALGMTFPAVPLRYNVAPTQTIPTIRQTGGRYELIEMRWGLIPSWAKETKVGYSTFNARAESVADKPMFRSSFRGRRCLVPVSGFYEWKTQEGRKQPYFITSDEETELVFAGLWDEWHGGTPEQRILSCTIIVGAANSLVAPIHDRMPVILPKEAYAAWLDAHTAMDEITNLLAPFPASSMRRWPVSPAVGNARNDSPGLIEPI